MSIEVEVQVTQAFSEVSVDLLRVVVEAALRSEDACGGLTLVITDDQSVQALNRDYLGRDTPTDVLAFSAQEDSGPFVTAPQAGSYLGDVIVSYPRAVAQAAEQGQPVAQELNLLVVHGVLHLLGYDHAGEEDKAAMWARQDAILRDL
jgi:probable rRNA maturation factor